MFVLFSRPHYVFVVVGLSSVFALVQIIIESECQNKPWKTKTIVQTELRLDKAYIVFQDLEGCHFTEWF